MSGYRVDPRAVHDITARARGQAEGVAAALQLLGRVVAEARTAVTSGSVVGTETAAALADVLADPLEVELRITRDHLEAAADRVDQAVGFFDEGDQQMAADFGRDAS